MIRSRLVVRDSFGRLNELLEQKAIAGLNAAAQTASRVAQEDASIDLELETIPAHPSEAAYSAGITSRKRSRSDGSKLATYFDKGTLGKRRAKLGARSKRKDSWKVNRGGAGYVAHRHELDPEKGIAAENFFAKARTAGRRALIDAVRSR
jgi:hypothetical protein